MTQKWVLSYAERKDAFHKLITIIKDKNAGAKDSIFVSILSSTRLNSRKYSDSYLERKKYV